MTYLRVRNFAKYQHYKSRQNFAWIKFYTQTLEDDELMQLPVETRYLFTMLLLLASRYANAIPNDSKRIANLLRMDPSSVSQGIQELLSGAWLSETRTNRKSRQMLDQSLAPVREDKRRKDLGLPRGVARERTDATRWHDTDEFAPLALPDGVQRLPEIRVAQITEGAA